MSLEQIREQLLNAILLQVAFEGWTDKALRMALHDEDLSVETGALAFPGGVPAMIEYWSHRADQRMTQAMQELSLDNVPTQERLSTAVRLRLEVVAGHREAVRRAIAFLALPGNVPLAVRLTHATIDALWYVAGDTATDYRYYTKRASLAAVYSATVLYWLDDESEGLVETWGFLDRRIADMMRMHRLRLRLSDGFAHLAEQLRLPNRLLQSRLREPYPNFESGSDGGVRVRP